MPEKRSTSSRHTLDIRQAAQLEERIRMEERISDKRYGRPGGAAAGTGSTRVLVRMPAQVEAANVQPKKPSDPSANVGAKHLVETMSRSLWSSLNPGYIQQEPGSLRSVASADYVWNEREIRDIEGHDTVGNKFHRRWDEQSRYNEAAALHRQVMKGPKERAAGAVKAS